MPQNPQKLVPNKK